MEKKIIERTGISKFILNKSSHFGFIRQSFTRGSVFTINFDEGYFEANGTRYSDLRDVNIAINIGMLQKFNQSEHQKIVKDEQKKIEMENEKKKQNVSKTNKMPVVKSDSDIIDPIPIPSAKKEENKQKSETMEVLRDDNTEEVRGMKVVRNISADNKNDGVDDIIDIKADKSGTNSYELEDMTLDQGRVVAKIEKKETNNEAKVVTKRINNKKVTKTAKNKSASEEKAKKIAESRKEAARIKREKMTSGEVELNEPNTPNQDGTVETDL